jgi:hypothetical protein
MSVLYSRRTPFGFVDEGDATDEDMFYAEKVDFDAATEKRVVEIAAQLRDMLRRTDNVQKHGLDAQAQAEEMAVLLKRVNIND